MLSESFSSMLDNFLTEGDKFSSRHLNVSFYSRRYIKLLCDNKLPRLVSGLNQSECLRKSKKTKQIASGITLSSASRRNSRSSFILSFYHPTQRKLLDEIYKGGKTPFLNKKLSYFAPN